MRNADPQVAQMVRGILDELQDAYAARDLEKLASLYDTGPGLTVIAAGPGEVARGIEQTRSLYDRDFRMATQGTMQLANLTVMQPNDCDTIAWAYADARFDLWINNQQRQIVGPFTAVIERQGDRWHIVQSQYAVPVERSSMPTQLWQHEGQQERRGEAA